MKQPPSRIVAWTIGTLVVLGLVAGAVSLNVHVLTREETNRAGSLSPVITGSVDDLAVATTPATRATPVVDAAARRAAVSYTHLTLPTSDLV